MTQYLTGRPFSTPTCANSKMTDLQYQIAVGTLKFCPTCAEYVAQPGHVCPEVEDADELSA